MNVIFLTMSWISDISQPGIYTDLLRKFRDEGHTVYVVTPHERRSNLPTELSVCDGAHILGVRTLNLQKTNVVEKGVGQVLVEGQYRRAIRRFFPGVIFDLILYSTPPITISKVISYLRKRNPDATTYLLLKDIFPQNAVDLGMMTKSGAKGLLYRFFRRKEKKLYKISDYIGCMSPANCEYVLRNNPEVSANRVEVAPNSVCLTSQLTPKEKARYTVRNQYGLPKDIPIFIYGGNLGKPQGLPYLIECLDNNADRPDCHFVVVGTGTELPRLQQWYEKRKPGSVTVMEVLPKAEYDQLLRACDVGLIFLDHRFTIPNYPSRLLNYLDNEMPVLCATDPSTDIGRIAEKNGFGFWCESNSVEAFTAMVNRMIDADRKVMGGKGYEFLRKNYTVDNTYRVIVSHF